MTKPKIKFLWLCFTILVSTLAISAFAQEPMPGKMPADVAGQWTVSALGEDGQVHTDYLTIRQNGSILTGHFKGPNQSGSFNGSINEQHVVIRSNTKHPVTFRGRAEGNTIQGTVSVMGRHGEFHAWRQGQ
jgi:hypothetical protein